jgi:holo-[acyl-carrier protein] synthase
MIVGIGTDLVDMARFERAISSTPRLLTRLFTEAERQAPVRTLAGRFAAKEAFIKAMGDPRGLRWQEVEITKDASGKPGVAVRGTTAETASRAGITNFHVSISHDAGLAMAFVVAEGN